MAKPQLNSENRWKKNEDHPFHLVGAGFDQNATVAIFSNGADWTVSGITVSADGTHLRFKGKPTTLYTLRKGSGSYGTSDLTIIVTNPNSGLSSGPLPITGTYEDA